MIDLHYAPTPNGWKISIMLEELGLPYTVIPVNIRAGEQFRPEFLAISPNNRLPAIVDHAPVEGAVRRGGAQEHVRADSEGDGGEELTARPLMVGRRPCAVLNHEAPTLPLILRDAREKRAPPATTAKPLRGDEDRESNKEQRKAS
jgi:hypothetical protein